MMSDWEAEIGLFVARQKEGYDTLLDSEVSLVDLESSLELYTRSCARLNLGAKLQRPEFMSPKLQRGRVDFTYTLNLSR